MDDPPSPCPCPRCQALVRPSRAGRNPSGSQRWTCPQCGRRFTLTPNRNGRPPELRAQVVRLCLEGRSFRAIARQLALSPQTVVNWINAYMRSTSRAIYHLPKK